MKYQQLEESSRWLAEANPTGWGQVDKPEAAPKPTKEAVAGRGKVSMCQIENRSGDLVTDKMIEALVLLEGRTRVIGARLEQIEARMGELRKEDERGRRALATISPGKIQIKSSQATSGYKCKMGRVILPLGILGILAPVESVGTMELETRRELVSDGIQGLLEGVTMGIEEKQSEMKEMDKNISIKKMELIELENTVQGRQMLLDLTSREVEEGLRKLEVEKRREDPSGGADQLHRDDDYSRRSSNEKLLDPTGT
jgi:hypothetical protein